MGLALPAGYADLQAQPHPQRSSNFHHERGRYHEERLLPACLRAIRAEIDATGCPAEILVVDNASTDSTAALARATPGVVVVPQPVRGLVQARSAGFAAASAPLVANIDADTLLPPGWLAKVLAAFAADPKLVALSGPYDYYDASPAVRRGARAFYAVAYCTYLVNRHVLRVGSMVQGGNFVVVRDALERAGGFDDTFSFYGEDTDIARRMSRVGRVRFAWALTARSSARRLSGDGVLATALRYSLNYLWTTFLRRPFTTAWIDHR